MGDRSYLKDGRKTTLRSYVRGKNWFPERVPKLIQLTSGRTCSETIGHASFTLSWVSI